MGSPEPRSRRSPAFSRAPKSRLGLWIAVAVGALVAAYVGVIAYAQPHVDGDRLSLSTFVQLAEDGRIVDARILDVDSFVVGTYQPPGATEPRRYNTPFLKDTRESLVGQLLGLRIPTEIDQQNGKRAVSLASFLLPGLIITLLFLYLILSYRRGTGLFAVRSGARRRSRGEAATVTFAEVAGQDAAVGELREITEYLAAPERFTEIGAVVPKGVLLYGPPGCGKTLLARAMAGEAHASFFSISGSDFVELYVGVGAARVRDLFREARESAPAIVFVDELDAVGRARAVAGSIQSQGEQEQALNQLLVEMDGFSPTEGIIVVGATNRPDVLDPALLRPGRFDRSVGLARPDEDARRAVLALHLRGKRVAEGVDVGAVARRAIGLTGADLAGLANEAALQAARAGRSAIAQDDLDLALQRVLDEPERQRRLSLRSRSIGKRAIAEERATFTDVAGVDDAVAELAEYKDYLIDPERFADLGARPPHGILLAGPPGCGKTLLARALAGEANAAFLSAAGSEFVTALAGQGAARVRDLFAEARSVAPAIVFIDEIDAVGTSRSTLVDGEREQTLNQILTELDGFEPRAGVMVMAATNRPELLDAALVRPGRFDRQVTVTLPDRAGRAAILALHARGKPLTADVDVAVVSGLTPGFSGADLANVLNEAALLAARRGLREISLSLVEEAVERATLGVSSRGVVLSDEERWMVACHEAGHAILTLQLRGEASLHKLSIVARGPTLGRCTVLDGHDRVLHSRSSLVDTMAIGLGGRIAEELLVGEPSSGSANDVRRVGEIARGMVRDLAMSDQAGLLAYPDAGAGGAYSEETLRLIDDEARRLVDEAGRRARGVLESARPALERVAAGLAERETLTVAEVLALAAATPLARRAGRAGPGAKGSDTSADTGD